MSASNINWYPGHMEKARRDMTENLKACDLVIEIRDARIPFASKNPVIDGLIAQKPRLIVLSKSDLADPEATAELIRQMTGEAQRVIAADLLNDSKTRENIIRESHILTKAKREKMISRGIKPRAMRAMVCGIPNVGKSTLINRIAGRTAAKTADKPGVTRSLTWIHCGKDLDIMDTPGVLWPKFGSLRIGALLAATGAIKEDILDLKTVVCETFQAIRERYPGVLAENYHLDESVIPEEILEGIARDRNLLKENGEADIDRAAVLFLRELRRGKLGLLTLEAPDEEE